MPFSEIEFHVGGAIADVASDVLVPGHTVTAPRLRITGDQSRITLAGAGLLVASAFRLFQRAKTPVPTYRMPTALVTSGVYRFTRNPIYLSMVLLMIGLAVTLDNIWLLALTAVFQQNIRWGVIAREEPYLEAKFGEEYRAFKQRTRRWI